MEVLLAESDKNISDDSESVVSSHYYYENVLVSTKNCLPNHMVDLVTGKERLCSSSSDN
jgi:hypothetical protein